MQRYGSSHWSSSEGPSTTCAKLRFETDAAELRWDTACISPQEEADAGFHSAAVFILGENVPLLQRRVMLFDTIESYGLRIQEF